MRHGARTRRGTFSQGRGKHPWPFGLKIVAATRNRPYGPPPGRGQLDHGRRRVGGDDLVTRVQQVPGQGPGAAADLQDEPAADRGQQVQDAGRAAVGVLAEAPGVHQGQVVLVVVHVSPSR
jgi:hypothetical protein